MKFLFLYITVLFVSAFFPQELSAQEKGSMSVAEYDTAVLFLREAEAARNVSLDITIEKALLAIRYINRYAGIRDTVHSEDIHEGESDNVLEIRQKAAFLAAKAYYATANSVGIQAINRLKYVNRAQNYFQLYLFFSGLRNDTLAIASAYNELAVIKTFEKDYGMAIEYYEKAFNIYEEKKYYTGLGRVRNNSGQLYSEMGDSERAWADFNYAVWAGSYADNAEVRSEAYLNLGLEWYKREVYDAALSYLDDAVRLCENNSVLRCKILLAYSRVYEKQHDFENAYRSRLEYADLRDNVLVRENLRHINELDGLLKNEQNKAEIKILTETKNTLNITVKILTLTVVFLLGAIVSAVVLYVKMQHRSKTVKIQTEKIKRQNEMLEVYNENMNSSLTYASRLQRLIIRGSVEAHKILSDFFVFYQPKDVVSGDFYYVRDLGQRKVVAVADCTGHGVPAAFLSVLNITFLNEIFSYIDKFTEPEMVLELLKIKVVQTLSQTSDPNSSMDGMDIGIVIADKETGTAKYAGAYIDLFILKAENFEVQTVKADRHPIGWYHKEKPFSQTELKLDEDDVIYMFSDGYTDQINSLTEKFTKFRMRKKIREYAPYGLEIQREKYIENFNNWKNGVEQVDDVLLVGIRVRSLFENKKIE